jgi:amidohydrolase
MTGRLKQVVQEKIDSLRDKLVEVSLAIYNNPEVRFEEFKACELLCKELEVGGFMVKRPIAGMETAFVAHGIMGKRPARPAFAFLCEYDALPELGHACGHNLIAGASLGAALALESTDFPATVVVIGTPAEEQGGGKARLIEAGVFDDIDAALMFHPSFKDEVGERMMAVQEVSVNFKGKAAHAAAKPEDGINALDAVISVFNSVNAMRQHLADDIRVHGVITDGGEKPNIVPERASCLFYLRAQDQKELDDLVKRFVNVVRGAEHATGAKAKIEYHTSYKARKLNLPFIEAVKRNIEVLGRKPVGPTSAKGVISSDIADVSQVVPAVHPFLNVADDITYHTREFAEAAGSDRGHETMILAAKALAMTAVDLALDKELFEKVKKAQAQPE